MKLRIVFHSPPYARETQVAILGEDANGNEFIVKPMPLIFTPINPSKAIEPTWRFSGNLATQFFPALVQALAESGYRYESSDAGELKATKIHLEDMRQLALGKGTK